MAMRTITMPRRRSMEDRRLFISFSSLGRAFAERLELVQSFAEVSAHIPLDTAKDLDDIDGVGHLAADAPADTCGAIVRDHLEIGIAHTLKGAEEVDTRL